jgi:hypothetical protein
VHEPTETDIFQALFFPLLARSLEIVDQLEVEQFSLPGDRVRLLIYSPLTSIFFVKDPRFVNQRGYVLYSVDVFEPESR